MSNHVSRSSALIALALLFVAGGCSSGADVSLSAKDAWARPASAGAETAVYLTITNDGTSADSLLSASSPAATSVGLHQSSTDTNGMTGMAPVAKIDIPAGQSVSLEPGGMHIMVTGLSKGLEVGSAIDLDLVFEHAGTVHVTAEVRQP